MNKNKKHTLIERMISVIPDFKMCLNEDVDKKFYINKLNEGVESGLNDVFMEYNKLSGNLVNDISTINEFITLSENDDFDPFGHLESKDKVDEKNDCLLYFGKGNAKLNYPVFSLPAGYTCPFANICKSMVRRDRGVDPKTGLKIADHGDVRCYGANMELQHPHVQNKRWENKDLLDKFDEAGKIDLIVRSLKYFEETNGTFEILRIHEAGDFYNQEYFDSWVGVAKQMPNILFYAYTKSLPFWIKRKTDIPDNLKLVASYGGTFDEMITKNDLISAVIVDTPEDAARLKLPIDIDDTLARNADKNFALLLHGVQSKASGKNSQSIKNSKLLKKYKNR